MQISCEDYFNTSQVTVSLSFVHKADNLIWQKLELSLLYTVQKQYSRIIIIIIIKTILFYGKRAFQS